MTRGEMRSRVRFFIDEEVQANFKDVDINQALNLAQTQVQLEITAANEDYFTSPTPTQITLASQVDTYPLHADADGECDVIRVKRVEDAQSGFSIMPLDLNEKIINTGILWPGPQEGAPTNFYLVGNSIGFTPIPQNTRTINYWFVRMLPAMTQDSDRSEIPRWLHDLIPIRAAIDSFVKDQETISQLQLLWDRGLDLLKRTVADRQIMAPKSVRRADDVRNRPYGYLTDGLL